MPEETKLNDAPELSSVYWNPEAKIELSGVELAALFQPLQLFNIPQSSVSIATASEIYMLAENAKVAILKRMEEAGELSSEPFIEG